MRSNLIFFPIASSLLMAGCAVTMEQCDPSLKNAGFGTKLGCSFSGGSFNGVYTQRLERLQLTLEEEKRLNANFRAVYAAVDKEKSEVRGELKRKRTDYASLERAMNVLLSDLKAKSAGNQGLQKEIAALEQKLAEVTTSGGTAAVQKQVELDALKARAQQLEAELGY